MLHLHHLANSRSFRIIWLLEELGVDYQLTCYERNKAYRAPDSLKNKSARSRTHVRSK